MSPESLALERAAGTAIKRVELSRPLRLALESGIVGSGDSVFDYGCGHGHDVGFLRELGHPAHGWDPYHLPGEDLRDAGVVNVGYVLNVIEDVADRREALRTAWSLATRALVVAVRTKDETKFVTNGVEHADGVITGADTFQKFFGQAEARDFIDETLQVHSIPLAVGVFVAFKDEETEQEWLDNREALRRRVRRLRRIVEPRRTLRDEAYETHRAVLRPLEEFIAERGRLPKRMENPWTSDIDRVFGSVPKAFQVIRHVAEEPWWKDAADDRRDEIRVRLALMRLRKRPKFGELPRGLRNDVKALFGSYKTACQEADDLLFSIADPEAVRAGAADSSIGKLTPEAIYVHVDAVDLLPPVLAVFIGAADAIIGSVAEATLVKVHFHKPRVSYLVYPDFESNPHPPLTASWVVDLRALDVRTTDFTQRDNPPILHRKELFVGVDHPRRATFERLTQQEERHGLLNEPTTIGTKAAWEDRLASTGWRLRGHRLVRVQ